MPSPTDFHLTVKVLSKAYFGSAGVSLLALVMFSLGKRITRS